ncbi:GNAT family N-acetyltransferase [Fodinicola feengrottensis]|uniref:GNAT family N-acetyltransferase n=1 Tax=Fodinicola feengrottensis TaxID=435914 RepID=UPI00244370CC|nr:GNAT family N-acetyltransferase [Fodinicola feengrottensis]
MGYGLVPSARRLGLITDAIAIAVTAAAAEAAGARVVAHTAADNLASQGALLKSGSSARRARTRTASGAMPARSYAHSAGRSGPHSSRIPLSAAALLRFRAIVSVDFRACAGPPAGRLGGS